MFRVYADYYKDGALNPDKKLLWSPEMNSEEYAIFEPVCVRELSAAGSLELTIPAANANYGAINRMTTMLYVMDVSADGEETIIWHGRVVEDEVDENGDKTITCEGPLAFLNDTPCRDSDLAGAYEESETLPKIPIWMYFGGIVVGHNTKVEPNKRFHVDMIVDITDTATDMSEYVATAHNWVHQIGKSGYGYSGADVILYSVSPYTITNCSYAHVYSGGDRNSKLYIIGIPDEYNSTEVFADAKTVSGCTVEPEGTCLIELDVSGYPTNKDQLDSLLDEYEGYIVIKDQLVNYERTADELTINGGSTTFPTISYTEHKDSRVTVTQPYVTPFTSNGGTMYPVISYVDDPSSDVLQTLTYGDNVTELSISTDCSELITALIPTGKQTEDWVGKISDPATVNGGVDYVFNQNAVDNFGYIYATKNWTDATDAIQLMAKAMSWMENHMAPKWSMEFTALDRGLIYSEYDLLEYGNRYRVVADNLDVNTDFILLKETLNLQDPASNKYEFYTETGAFTDAEFQNGSDESYRFKPVLESEVETLKETYASGSWAGKAMAAAIVSALDEDPTIIPKTVGTQRPNLNNTEYITPTKTLFSYPSVSALSRNAPFGKASYVCVVIKNTSTNRVFQVSFNGTQPEFAVYRKFYNGKQVKPGSKEYKWRQLTTSNMNDVWAGT